MPQPQKRYGAGSTVGRRIPDEELSKAYGNSVPAVHVQGRGRKTLKLTTVTHGRKNDQVTHVGRRKAGGRTTATHISKSDLEWVQKGLVPTEEIASRLRSPEPLRMVREAMQGKLLGTKKADHQNVMRGLRAGMKESRNGTGRPLATHIEEGRAPVAAGQSRAQSGYDHGRVLGERMNGYRARGISKGLIPTSWASALATGAKDLKAGVRTGMAGRAIKTGASTANKVGGWAGANPGKAVGAVVGGSALAGAAAGKTLGSNNNNTNNYFNKAYFGKVANVGENHVPYNHLRRMLQSPKGMPPASSKGEREIRRGMQTGRHSARARAVVGVDARDTNYDKWGIMAGQRYESLKMRGVSKNDDDRLYVAERNRQRRQGVAIGTTATAGTGLTGHALKDVWQDTRGQTGDSKVLRISAKAGVKGVAGGTLLGTAAALHHRAKSRHDERWT